MKQNWRNKLNEIIFRTETPLGRYFDIALLIIILTNVLLVMLESIPSINRYYGLSFLRIEWVITILFTIEYLLRIFSAENRKQYVTSFFGIIDLLAILPTYLTLLVTGLHPLMVIRALRVLRLFRIFKLSRYLSESNIILNAVRQSKSKIIVFITTVLLIVLILGTMMYLVETSTPGFGSIPESIYWAIVTLTTVGYGDTVPVTVLGKIIACLIMLMGFSLIAVPTGIVSAEFIREKDSVNFTCENCGKNTHDKDSLFCSSCGQKLRN